MKKIIASLLASVLLLSTFVIAVFAADDDTVLLSIKGAEGKPGDIVEVQVYMDQNPGLWACGFDIVYNPAYFQLGDVENGDVFSDATFVKSPIVPSGSYRFYAAYTDISKFTEETGLLVTLRFKVLETAPNGNHNVSIELLPGNWFVQNGTTIIRYDAEVSGPATIKVGGSEATAPVTDADTTVSKDSVDKDEPEETTGRVVTEYVTDTDNYVVRNEDGEPVTQVVTSVVTGDDGNPIFDENGNPITEIVTEIVTEPEQKNPEDEDVQKDSGMKKIILIVGIVLSVVAAAVIVVILFNARKKGDASKDEKADQSNTDDSNKQE